MSASKRRVEGYDYLYQRGHSYEVRVQVPQPLKAIVGKGELKKSLGSDMRQVGKKHPGVLAGFLAQLEAARESGSTDNHRPNHTRNRPTPEQVHAACYAHFLRMSRNMRGKVAYPTGDNPRTLPNRIAGFQSMIENQVSAHENGAWSIMAGDAERLCDEYGWTLAPDDELFYDLCGLMIRARTQCYRNEVRQLQGIRGPDPDADPMFGPAPPVPSKPSMTLGDLVTKFTSARDVNWSTSTTKNYTIIFRVIEELCGKDTPLADIDTDFCIGVRKHLLEVPSNYQKRPATRGKTLMEAIDIAAREGLPKISPATVNSHLSKLGAIIRYGRDQGWIVGNPMAKIEVKDPVADEDKRDPFKVHQLNAIFACEPWSSGPGAAVTRPSRYWAPLISLFSGARLTEICGQLVSEMIEEHGVRLFDFRHRPGVRDMKNDKSRMVPVHPSLIKLGFWDYVEEARASGRELLFPDVSPNKLGNWGDPTSKWFTRLIDRLGLKGTALCFHSFRHTFEDGLKEIDFADTPIGNVITGRVSPGVSKNYGSKYTVTKLAAAIGRVDFKGLELPEVMFTTGSAV
ncbi:MAG: phage integrase SAM-like domain-containing protein [Novosphingobium sp.]|uniref:phage integrase SAM-like domain-containing protein n=1 Tax=Novosphingobium sp. TaxID=1874826 RepID=UPI0030183C3D